MEQTIAFKMLDIEGGITDVECTRSEAWGVVYQLLTQLECVDA